MAKTKKAVKKAPKRSGSSITGFVLGILALSLCWIPFFGLTVAVLGIVFSGIGMGRDLRGLAIAGLILSIIAVIPAIIVTLGVIGFLSMMA
jgi:hypothetical protein